MTTEALGAGEPPRSFTAHRGFEGVQATSDSASLELRIDDRHRSPRGLMHGGALLGLADAVGTALAMRSNAVEAGGSGRPMAVIDVPAAILGNQAEGVVRAEASIVRRGRRVTVIRVRVLGEDGRPLAEMTTTNVPV
jgi:uncharacterized protein (TIGR00369 family)